MRWLLLDGCYQVARAYNTLTDPAAKENYELYGNPDGRQSLAVRSLSLSHALLVTSTAARPVNFCLFPLLEVTCDPLS